MSEVSVQEDVHTLIPEWTFEDFLGSGPYEWLYKHKDNKFLLQQMLVKAQFLAKEVKFPTFTKMWNAYVESMSPKATIMGNYVTMFPDQPVQWQSGKYICDEFGIAYTGRMGDMIEVCSHPIMPVKRIIDIDSNAEKLDIAYSRGGKWRNIIVGRENLASAQKIIQLARNGIAVNSENAKELVKYITDIESINYDKLDIQNSTEHMGWLQNGSFAPFCDGIVYGGESTEFSRIFDGFKPTGDYEKWLELARSVRHGRSVPARLALAASFAAPIVSICGALPFFVHLWGTQGCGKTVGLMLAASVWGNPDIGSGYIKSFGGTKVSQELYAAFCCNVPVLLDELQVISDRKMFDDIIYMLCEGMSKGRGAKEGGLQLQRRWSTCMISTGEMPIVQSNSGGGAAVRTIEVNYGGEPLFADARGMANALKENYGFAGRIFVEALKDPKMVLALKEVQKKQYQKLSGTIQDKQVLSASLILAADRMADALIFKDKSYLRAEDIKPYLVTQKEADVNYRCYQWLLGFIGSNPRRFDPQDMNSGEMWGVKEDNVVYIIRSVFDKILRGEGYSPSAFLTWASRNNKILFDTFVEQNRLTKRKKIGDNRLVCVALVLEEEDEEEKPERSENRIETEEEREEYARFIRVDTEDLPFLD